MYDDTLLREIIGNTKTYVDKIHHQAVNKLGKDLKVYAISEDGIIEPIQSKDVNGKFLLAI